MVKKKGSREMNPADAHRKALRAKEIARNKKERKFTRDALSLQTKPDAIKRELEEALSLEENGRVNQTVRLKIRALQNAYDAALKKKKEEEMRPHSIMSTNSGNAMIDYTNVPEYSVYYHPTINPSGMPPPGKPQRFRFDVNISPNIGANLSQVSETRHSSTPLNTAVPLPPPSEPPPFCTLQGNPKSFLPKRDEMAKVSKPVNATIQAAATVIRPVKLEQKSFAMVPASLLVKRDKPAATRKNDSNKFSISSGKLVGSEDKNFVDAGGDKNYADFMLQMASMGALK